MGILERRLNSRVGIELRELSRGKYLLQGYAARYLENANLVGFTESILPRAFVRALNETQDVFFLGPSSPGNVLGRTKSRTCELGEDSTGLWFRVSLPVTSYANELVQSIQRRDVGVHCSICFKVTEESWYPRSGTTLREIEDLDLFDISVVTSRKQGMIRSGGPAEPPRMRFLFPENKPPAKAPRIIRSNLVSLIESEALFESEQLSGIAYRHNSGRY